MTPGFQHPLGFSFREDHDFASFVAGRDNEEVLAYLRGFARGTDTFCLVRGDTGHGKSHLLQALCREAPDALYLPLLELRAHGPDVLQGLAGHPLLVLDDLDAVLGVAAWEERLFHLFNVALQQDTRVCASTTVPLADMDFVLADLRSRLQLAVVFVLKGPDEAAARQILRQVAGRRGMMLRDDVLDYLLSRHQRDLPSLLGLLDRLDHLSLAEKRRLTIPFIRETLGW